MEEYNERISKLVNRNKKKQKKANRKANTLLSSDLNRVSRKPIDESQLFIREFKSSDRFGLYKIVNDYHRDFYIGIYKQSFRSWFTYILTGCLLAMSVSILHSSIYGLCLPPVLMTLFILWKVNKFKKTNWILNVSEMEMLNQTESHLFKFKTAEARRKNQGVLLAFLKEESSKQKLKKKLLSDDFNLFNLKESDLENLSSTNTESSSSDNDKDEDETENRRIVGYMIYTKQKDELETVVIRDICIEKIRYKTVKI